MSIANKFDLGSTVYLVTDTENRPWIVTGILVDASLGLSYRLVSCKDTVWCHSVEISKEKACFGL